MQAVSIIIAVRNGAAFIAEAIGSALSQGPSVSRVIIVDDHSTDDTIRICAAFADDRVVVMQQSAGAAGVSGARNLGLDQADTDWVMFLDADDRLQPHAIDGLLKGATDPQIVAVYGDYRRIDASGRSVGSRRFLTFRQKPSGRIATRLIRGNFIVNGGVMLVRRREFLAIGSFDTALTHGEDWHAWCRLACRGRFIYQPNLHVLDYRVHATSTMNMANAVERSQRTVEALFSNALILESLPSTQLAELRRAAEAHLRIFAFAQTVRQDGLAAASPAILRTLREYPDHARKALITTVGAAVGF